MRRIIRYRLSAIGHSKSNGQASLRGATYDESFGLESCSRDPIGYRSGINVFRYCRNRVASLVDPTGLVDIGTGIGGTIGGTIGATIGGAIGGTGGTIGGGVVGTVGGPVGTIGGGVVGGVEGTIVGAGVGGSIGVGVGIGIENLITDIYDGVAEGIDYIIDDIARDQAERSKPIERSRGDRMKSTDDPFTQLEEIEQAQREVRNGTSDKIIDSIEKSRQRCKNELKDIANNPDLLDDLD